MSAEFFCLHAASVLLDGQLRQNKYVTVQDGVIRQISDQPPAAVPLQRLAHGVLVPGFIDTQVNGGGGVLFNQQPTLVALQQMMQAHGRFGTTAMLPTVITDDIDVMRRAADAVAQALQQALPGIVGIHFEGPHLSTAKRGCHPLNYLRPLTEAELALYLRADLGVRLLTVAPEHISPQQIRLLVQNGVLVSLGHSNASADVVMAALDAGASGFTHLYNGMSALTSREPGMVGCALADKRAYCGIILDGEHLHPLAARVAFNAKGVSRLMLVTDAMSPVGTNDSEFAFFDGKVQRCGMRLTNAQGSLAGSVLDMASAVHYAATELATGLVAAVQMASSTPAAFIGQSAVRGAITEGLTADLVWLNAAGKVQASWIAGRLQ
ncbi:N-acetylglucosamine-6-phosphate deacetylase [Rheinheimera sp. NSM]|uniref:N-acetylglucosamine-6-phosphate deacetylase n=1 Tax=Rheinheimera sp. NSM TaxID=3457884 RepID=UPI004036DE94